MYSVQVDLHNLEFLKIKKRSNEGTSSLPYASSSSKMVGQK